jgi:hypothetical protein
VIETQRFLQRVTTFAVDLWKNCKSLSLEELILKVLDFLKTYIQKPVDISVNPSNSLGMFICAKGLTSPRDFFENCCAAANIIGALIAEVLNYVFANLINDLADCLRFEVLLYYCQALGCIRAFFDAR